MEKRKVKIKILLEFYPDEPDEEEVSINSKTPDLASSYDIPKALQGALQSRLTPDKQAVDANLWFNQNGNSTWEILRLGAKNWQKGKIRVRVIVDFYPDEPEKSDSSLDDIRQTINPN